MHEVIQNMMNRNLEASFASMNQDEKSHMKLGKEPHVAQEPRVGHPCPFQRIQKVETHE